MQFISVYTKHYTTADFCREFIFVDVYMEIMMKYVYIRWYFM